jgi:RNA polymerase sigma-70 factor (ECF subfamily)
MMNEHDQLAFMRLWTAAQPAVANYVHAVLRDRTVAEDVLQETSMVLFRRFVEYDANLPFVAWALGVAKNQILGLHRDQARSRVIFNEELLARFTATWADLSPRMSDRGLALQDCLERLPAHARRLVRMRYFDDLPSEQIAQQHGGTGAAVRVALQRIRQQLRECVEQQFRIQGEAP